MAPLLQTVRVALQDPEPQIDLLAELDRVIAGGITPAYQPIVDLASGAAVAYEALARGPVDSPLHTPGALFGTAARAGRLTELDWACRAAALGHALGTALERPTALFVNIEPVAAMAAIPAQFEAVVGDAIGSLDVVFELTERALTERPAEVLQAVRALRALGAQIALDDVGVDPRSLALMPFLAPDVIKLDMSLVQGDPSPHMARVMHAVNAESQRSGAIVLAEGIENEAHLERANALGATHGQGWFFGRPAPAPTHRVVTSTLPRRDRASATEALQAESALARLSPYELVATTGQTPRVASKGLLLALSRQLEVHAQDLGPEAVILSNLQHVRHATPHTLRRYGALAEQAAFVGLIGEDLDHAPTSGVRGGPLAANDPLRKEWNVSIISPHFAAAMVARDLGDDHGDDMERRFEYFLTYRRREAVDTAKVMMSRIAATT